MRVRGFLRGTVELEVKGSRIEAFINLLHRAKIPLLSPRRTEEGILRCAVYRSDFKKLRVPAFKTASRVHITKKRGLGVLLRPVRRRWGLALGMLLFFSLIFYSYLFVWQVEVHGCEQTSSTEILADLEELGLRIGCRRSIDVEWVENRYLTGNDKLIWMSINIRGTTAYVEVKEQQLTPKVEDLSVPTNIYAARDGIIRMIRDYGGFRQVQVGEPVTAGDLLVSGDWTDQYGVRRTTHCVATVIAETRRETDVSVPFKEVIREKTGKFRKKYAVSFGKLKISLYFTKKISYNKYDIVEKEYPLRLGAYALPIRFYEIRIDEVEERSVLRSADEARAVALRRLGFYEKDLLSSVSVLKREVKETLSEDRLTLHAVFYCEEEIGLELPIKE